VPAVTDRRSRNQIGSKKKGPRRQAGGGLELRRIPGRRERRRGIDLDQNL
jgi:hypothetical protein